MAIEDHTATVIEDFTIDVRLLYERAYQQDPARTSQMLVQRGYWHVAAQLQVDYVMGRLAE